MKNILKLCKEKPYLPILALAGILLLLFGAKSTAKTEEKSDASAFSAEEYREALQEEAKMLCQKVCSGEVYVVLTLEGTETAVYAKDTDGTRETVVKAGSSPAVAGYEMPRVAGVAVVCAGGEKSEVKQALTDLLRAAFHISASKICISGVSLF